MSGDPDEDSVTMEYDRPTRQEIASVIALAARLYLGGAATPRRGRTRLPPRRRRAIYGHRLS